jgi:BASS family bile acid:Na+ symporter
VLIFRFVSNALAPLTLLGAVLAYLHPPSFLIFKDSVLWFFATTMFALGLVLNPSEFRNELKRFKRIGFGLATQFTVMPLVGFLVAYFSGFEPGLALGFVIVGCAPGAMASNVIVFLSGGATAYSVALTTAATMLAPLLTPSLVEVLGGVYLPIPFLPMMKTILVTVLGPLIGGMLVRKWLGDRLNKIAQMAPAVAVMAIVVIVGVGVASNRSEIVTAGGKVFVLVVLVNLLGYLAGWQAARLFGFDKSHRTALMIEIGMQNAGLGVVLALRHFSPETALPGVLFAVWCILTAAGATSYLRRGGPRFRPR